MIDIVFLLLIFFLVTYQITEQEKDLKVAVPTTSEGSQKARVANKIVINLAADGEITISGEVYTKDQLRQKLKRIV
ncbi:biopolymer transporter ExbD, partial [Akkermansiaceae bacterium]|nr:biopolymer transporter ExbD [Akkermansiaceae bacterium]